MQRNPEAPSWAIQKVLDQCGYGSSVKDVLESPWQYGAIHAFAQYISEHEEPPVDPALLRAREIYAESFTVEETKAWVIRGEGDNLYSFKAILKALKEQPPESF